MRAPGLGGRSPSARGAGGEKFSAPSFGRSGEKAAARIRQPPRPQPPPAAAAAAAASAPPSLWRRPPGRGTPARPPSPARGPRSLPPSPARSCPRAPPPAASRARALQDPGRRRNVIGQGWEPAAAGNPVSPCGEAPKGRGVSLDGLSQRFCPCRDRL
ncbi:unnamed protein product [Rangifer tarandus platyrhynchus]|uniref:Uncharacterized protein n=2 Tax=Rangifer tarandus platyrhynchus TaxID=3082113 RepID=A0ABN8YEZ1_RANTA|nr:unnamed protein product [Rangifer tarandus platyrhynchus]CAI9699535.1 unnamed protein product [Rangifer tarandus platyrhynchus]